MKQILRYGNLTQVTLNDPAVKVDRLVYLRSTDVEQMNYERLMWSVPDEWLYLMAEGYGIEVIDKSSNRKGKIERIFIPTLVDVLNTLYHVGDRKTFHMEHHYLTALDTVRDNTQLFTKYRYWHGKINEVNIKGTTIHVEKDAPF